MKLMKRIIFACISASAVICSLAASSGFSAAADAMLEDEWYINESYYVNDDGVFGYTTYYVYSDGPMEEVCELPKGTYVYAAMGYESRGIEWASCFSDSECTEWYGMVDMSFLSKTNEPSYITLEYYDINEWYQCTSNGVVTFDETYVSGNGSVSQSGHEIYTFSNDELVYITRGCSSMGISWAECYKEDGTYCGYIDMSFVEYYVPPAATTAPDIPEPPTAEAVVTEEAAAILTEPVTSAAETTMNTVPTAFTAPEHESEKTSSVFSANAMVILLGALVLLLAITALIIILIISRTKSKTKTINYNSNYQTPPPVQNPQVYDTPQFFCMYCGNTHDGNSRFCEYCGKPLQ